MAWLDKEGMSFNCQPMLKIFQFWTSDLWFWDYWVVGGWVVCLSGKMVWLSGGWTLLFYCQPKSKSTSSLWINPKVFPNSYQYWTSDLWIWTFGLDNDPLLTFIMIWQRSVNKCKLMFYPDGPNQSINVNIINLKCDELGL